MGQYSIDGAQWFAAAFSSPAGASVAYGEGVFVSVGPDYYGFSNPRGGPSAMVAISSDGQTWRTVPAPTTNYLYGVGYGNGRFVGGFATVLQSGTQPFALRSDRWKVHPNGFEAHLIGERDRSFRIEVSTNLLEWSELSVVDRPKDGVLFLDASPPSPPRRLYRAVAP